MRKWAAIAGASLAVISLAVWCLMLTLQVRALRAEVHHNQTAQLTRQMAGIQAQVKGEHRNLITCGDMQAMINNGQLASYYQDSGFNLQSQPDSLPPHCINR